MPILDPTIGGSSSRGQSLVEFSILVPVFMLLLLGMIEFGFAFTHDQTLEYATREGARTGAALANGGGSLGCGSGQSPNAATVDPQIIAAVERVLTSTGSPVADHLSAIPTIRIFGLDGATRAPLGTNVWSYAAGAGPVVDGKALDYKLTSTGWAACSRDNGDPADAIGVALDYQYQFVTPLGGVVRLLGGSSWSTLSMSDQTVMNLNPTN